jgi:hypothetical protein
MNPFDKAWLLLKAPIVPGTMHQTGKNEYTALFQDPQTNEILPVYGSKQSYPVAIDEHNPVGGNIDSYKAQILEAGGEKYERGGKLSYDDDPRRAMTSISSADFTKPEVVPQWTQTRGEHKNKGYMQSLYDFAAVMAAKDKNRIVPSVSQTEAVKNAWKGRDEWPIPDNLEF